MKNYKLLVPIIMIALFVLGVYMVGSENLKKQRKYDEYLKNARDFAAQRIEIYAIENYQAALDMRPSPALYREVGEFYRDTLQDLKKALDWGDIMLKSYPKEKENYEFQLENLLIEKDYKGFFKLYDQMTGRRISSEKAEALYASEKYDFYLQGEYDEIRIFSGNMAAVRKNETWGYCSATGKKKISTMYVYAGDFNNKMAPVIDAQGEAYFIDADGNRVKTVNAQERIEKLGMMTAAEIYSVCDGSQYSFYDNTGERLMSGFSEAGAFANGVAAAKTGDGWKLYDTKGKEKNAESYAEIVMDEKAVAYRNERLFVSRGNGYELIDIDGKQIGSTIYDAARLFCDDTYAAVQKDGKWGFIDRDGNWFIEPAYEDARSFLNGYAAVCLDGLWGFINAEKELCIPCQFDEAKDFSTKGTVPVRENTIWKVLILYKDNH